MATRLLLSCICFCLTTVSHAQNVDVNLYRTIDGQYNNPDNRNLGAQHTALVRYSGNGFTDGQSLPAGLDRPNPRAISNALFAQEGLLNDPVGLSDFTWVFGQFIDHDLGLTDRPGEDFNIPVPMGDPAFDPLFFGTVEIPMHRNAPRFGTGSGTGNPRQYDNEITAFIDGSGVYGSDQARADWLRAFTDGKLKVSADNLLPYNTVDGERASRVDLLAPHMADGVGHAARLFIAGDVRANENPLLLTFHTLFVREHNRQCDLLKAAHPDWTDEQLYQHARKMVGGLIQSITYDEWLPAMGVEIPAYAGYDRRVNPQLTNVFSAAAFRVGHTLLNGNIRRVGPDGQVLEDGNLTLREAFFNPDALREVGLDPYLRGMAEQIQQEMDNRVVDDVRNFLFGPPGAGGLDLAAININRGRDRGLPSYNRIRRAYNLSIQIDFNDINPNPEVSNALAEVYGNDINKLDPWVAMLAERPMDGSIFGQTIQRILAKQFTDLRDGDRFFYQNDPLLTDEEKEWIQSTTFRDVVMYNSGISLMQDNVFEAMPFSEICGSMTVEVDGLVRVHTTDAPLPEVTVSVLDPAGDALMSTTTSTEGYFNFTAIPACQGTRLHPSREDDWAAGLNILDLVAIQRHILGLEALANPYQYFAADVNGDDRINVLDVVALARIILAFDTELRPPPHLPWNFFAAGAEFADPTNPFAGPGAPNILDFSALDPAEVNQGFVAFKLGDVNASADLTPPDNLNPGLSVSLRDDHLAAGEVRRVKLRLRGEDVAAFQVSLRGRDARILRVEETDLSASAYALRDDELQILQPESGRADHEMTVTVRAQSAGMLSDLLTLSADQPSVAVGTDGRVRRVNLGADAGAGLELESKVHPNPFVAAFQLTLSTPLPQPAELRLTDLSGRVVFRSQLTAGTERTDVAGAHLPQGTFVLEIGTSRGEVFARHVLTKVR